MAEMLGMMLDFLDALCGAVGIAYWWCTWVKPDKLAGPDAPRSEGPEIERFLHEARAGSRNVCP